MAFVPYIVGSGRAAQALEKAFACLSITEPEHGVLPVVHVPRGASLKELLVATRRDRGPLAGHGPWHGTRTTAEAQGQVMRVRDILVIAGPPGLHAKAILEANEAGFDAVVCEKPVCVRGSEIETLARVSIPVAVAHVYRQTWGVRALRDMLHAGEIGELVTLEGRYWQASSADRARNGFTAESARSWKNEPSLSGPADVLLDVGTHWFDASNYVLGAAPLSASIWRSHVGAEAPHRDTHVQAVLSYPGNVRAFASISKMMHGATNHFELNLVGTRASATWTFLDPDRIHIGEGRESRVVVRKTTDRGARQMPFHGLGWLEGYVDILSNLLRFLEGQAGTEYPTLGESLALMRVLAPELGE